MTPTPYVTSSWASPNDGRFYGTLSYGTTVIATATEGTDAGFKSPEAFDRWAREKAHEHKRSIMPQDTHVVSKTFAL